MLLQNCLNRVGETIEDIGKESDGWEEEEARTEDQGQRF